MEKYMGLYDKIKNRKELLEKIEHIEKQKFKRGLLIFQDWGYPWEGEKNHKRESSNLPELGGIINYPDGAEDFDCTFYENLNGIVGGDILNFLKLGQTIDQTRSCHRVLFTGSLWRVLLKDPFGASEYVRETPIEMEKRIYLLYKSKKGKILNIQTNVVETNQYLPTNDLRLSSLETDGKKVEVGYTEGEGLDYPLGKKLMWTFELDNEGEPVILDLEEKKID